MKQRKTKQIIKRLLNLPRFPGSIQYGLNALALLGAKRMRLLKQPHPNFLMLEVTNRCQLRCTTCARQYHFGHAMDVGHMELDEAKKIISQNHLYLDKIALTGLGEPLLYPHLQELVAFIKSVNPGLLIFLSTNAQLPKTKEIVSTIAPSIDTLQISIDGTGMVFETIREKADFVAFTNNCRDLVALSEQHTFEVKFNMVVFKENFREMRRVITLSKELGIQEVSINSLNHVALGTTVPDYSFYSTPAFTKELKHVHALAQQFGIAVVHPNIGQRNSFSTCPFPWGNYSISWDGYLVPCCAKPFWKELHFGNVFERGLMACVNDKKLQAFREMAKKDKTPEFCVGCHHVN